MNIRGCLSFGLCVVVLLISGCGKEDRPDQADAAKRPAVMANKNSPSVLIISLDAVRYDHLHCYGYERETSPRIDQMAQEGALFETFISSSPWCLPSQVSLLTGMVPSIHGVVDVNKRLSPDGATLAKDFRDVGYQTAAFVSNPFLSRAFGLDKGFDDYVEYFDPPAGDAEARAANATSGAVVQAVENWLGKKRDGQFFLFVNFSDAMFDYTPPPPFDKRFDPEYTGPMTGRNFVKDPRINPEMSAADLEHLKALYDGEIAWVDQCVGRLLDRLMVDGLLDSTIVVLTSSHGTGFFEHKMKGQRNSLYDELIRVPLIIRCPRMIPAGKRIKQQCTTPEVYPTIAHLAGLPIPPVMGMPLTPLLAGQSLEGLRPEIAVSELSIYGRMMRSIRQSENKTIWDVQADQGSAYDLVADPGELAPLTDKNTPIVKSAREAARWVLRRFLKDFEGQYPAAEDLSEIPSNSLSKLNALGYINGQIPMIEQKP